MGDNGKKARYTKTVRIRISPSDFSDLEKIAKAYDISVSELVRRAITSYKNNFTKNIAPAIRFCKQHNLLDLSVD